MRIGTVKSYHLYKKVDKQHSNLSGGKSGCLTRRLAPEEKPISVTASLYPRRYLCLSVSCVRVLEWVCLTATQEKNTIVLNRWHHECIGCLDQFGTSLKAVNLMCRQKTDPSSNWCTLKIPFILKQRLKNQLLNSRIYNNYNNSPQNTFRYCTEK